MNTQVRWVCKSDLWQMAGDATMAIAPSPQQNKARIRRLIDEAFAGVRLGAGLSLRAARARDACPGELDPADFVALAEPEVVDDWHAVPLAELEHARVFHLDPLGFRYYIPALLLSVLDRYDGCAMRSVATLAALYPRPGAWELFQYRYSALNDAQRSAIACFLEVLPDVIDLWAEDALLATSALHNYWGRYLPDTAGHY